MLPLPYNAVLFDLDGVLTSTPELQQVPVERALAGGSVEAARRLAVAPPRAAVVEDALAGVAAGHAGRFGLVIGVARSAPRAELLCTGAHVVVDDLAELLP
jgi:beta-phosphoglucomutase-like phosphatase (HAD superfamily)